jgi:L-threonylcarbamoyladenylate synthase
MICRKSDYNSVEIAVDFLSHGKIVILPTDTVYGFSGIVDTSVSGTCFHTDDKIRKIKGRQETKPLIQLIATPEDLALYTDDVIPGKLLEKWPGALTIIVHNRIMSEKNTTTAFRCPGDAWLRKIIRACGSPVYSTSVNRSGLPVLETETDIEKEFAGEVDLIVTAGDTKGALPSTLVSVENGKVTVIRQGSITV